MKSAILPAIVALLCIMVLALAERTQTSTAYAAASVSVPEVLPDPGADPGGFFSAAVDALKTKDFKLVVILAIVGFVYALRRWGGLVVPWFKSDRGGALLALVTGVLAAGCATAAAGAPFDLHLLVNGLEAGVLAAGGFAVVKKLLWPRDPDL